MFDDFDTQVQCEEVYMEEEPFLTNTPVDTDPNGTYDGFVHLEEVNQTGRSHGGA